LASWTKTAIEMIGQDKYIDVADLGLKDENGEVITKLPFRYLSTSETTALYNHPKVIKTKDQSQRDLIYSQLLVHRMLEKADPTLTEKEFFDLPVNIVAEISKRILSEFNMESPNLKN